MSDMKRAFEKAGIKGGGGGEMKKKCVQCQKEFIPKEPHYKICEDCIKKKRYEATSGYDKPAARLSNDYLKGGYFDENGYLRVGIFKEDAKEVANVLAALRMTPTSLRAFYNKLKAIESRYKTSSSNFDSIKPNLYAFERDVAYQVSRGVVSEEFRKFINKNSELAIKGPKEFKGFIEHFLSVLAYFKDVSRQ
ncbi:MAG: type III-A CRISPR-associated protein Csm2 [Nitrospirae bacterium]|nr:type III-A CRISPR-associated protein Csm2 [Nitrospirota bacterium]